MRNIGRTMAALSVWAGAAAAHAQTAALESASDASSITVQPMTVAPVTAPPGTSVTPAPTPPIAPAPTGPAPMVAVPQAVYVTRFIAVPSGASPSGLLARMRAALHARAEGRDAGLVAQAVVQGLNRAGVAARYLAPGEPAPATGWLIGGAFHQQGETPADNTAPENQASSADVSVTVADLEHNADTPFAVIGAPPAASSAQNDWRPYVVPAKLAFAPTDRNAAVAELAQQIVNAFVGNMTALRQADARTLAP